MEEKTTIVSSGDFGKDLNNIIYKAKDEEEVLKKFLNCPENEFKKLTEVMQFLIKKCREKYKHLTNNKIYIQTAQSQMVKDALILSDTKDSILQLLRDIENIDSDSDTNLPISLK